MGNLSLDHLIANATAEPASYAAADRSTDSTSFGQALQRASQPAERRADPPTLPDRPAHQPERRQDETPIASPVATDSSKTSDTESTEAADEAATEAQLPARTGQQATDEDAPAEDEEQAIIEASAVVDPAVAAAIKTAELLTLEVPAETSDAAQEACGVDCTPLDVPNTTAISSNAAKALGNTSQTAVATTTTAPDLKLPVKADESKTIIDEADQEAAKGEVDAAPITLEALSTPSVDGTDRAIHDLQTPVDTDTATLVASTNASEQHSSTNSGEPDSNNRFAASDASTSTLEQNALPQGPAANAAESALAGLSPIDRDTTAGRGNGGDGGFSPANAAAGSEATGSTETQPAAGTTATTTGIDAPAPLPKTFVDQLNARVTSRTVGQPQISEADRARFVQRVAGAFQAAEDGGGQVRLRLSPPELGALRLDVTLRGGVLSAHLEAETPQARTLLLDSLPALRDRLAEQNIRIERFEVELMNGSPGGQPHGFSQRESSAQENANKLRPRTVAETTTESAASGASPERLGGGQLNVVI